MRRLIYVDPYEVASLGISRKIEAQIRALGGQYKVVRKWVVPSASKGRLWRRMLRELGAIVAVWRADFVYYRYSPVLVVFNTMICWMAGRRSIWVEYNSVYERELELVSPRALPLHRWSIRRLRKSRVHHLPVVGEIAQQEKLSGSVHVLGNGCLEDGAASALPGETEAKLDAFLAGGDSCVGVYVGGDHSVWHGVDRLVDLLEDNNLRLVLVGEPYVGDGYAKAESAGRLVQLGKLAPEALGRVYEKVDFGFGTFALDRKDMREACPLKVRDYLIHGLRVVVNYDDVLMADAWAKPYLYRFSTEDSNALMHFIQSPAVDRGELAGVARRELSWTRLLTRAKVLRQETIS